MKQDIQIGHIDNWGDKWVDNWVDVNEIFEQQKDTNNLLVHRREKSWLA